MSDLEFLGRMNPKRLTSLEEDFKTSQQQYRDDMQQNALRRAGKLVKPEPEVTRERIPNEVINKPDLSQLLRSGRVIPASELAERKEIAQMLSKDLEEAVRSEVSHRRTKIQTEPDKSVAHYIREPFLD